MFVALALAIATASPTMAQDPAESSPSAAPAIETRVGAADDAMIAERIRSIFHEVPALADVDVRSSAGVVTLRGSVPETADIARAEAIASRVSGVVTIENALERDLAVDTNVSPALDSLSERGRAIVRALPLMSVAVLIAALIGVFGYFLAGLGGVWRAVTPNGFLAELVATSIRFVFVLLGIVTALEILGATALLGAVLGGAGVIGIAVGFAVRDTIDNYISSLMLSLRQPFRANDHVVIEGSEGRVVRLTSRATILMTLDGNHLRIPNSSVFKAVILNYTRNPERRFEFDLGIDADDDAIDGMSVGLKAINALPFVLDKPEATAVIQDVGDSSIILRFHGWVDQRETDFRKGRSLAIQAAKCALEDSGFALPEPIYRLRFDENAPLSIGQSQSGKEQVGEATPRERTVRSSGHDTAPENHVEQLVRDERAEGSGGDLLDNRRPVE